MSKRKSSDSAGIQSKIGKRPRQGVHLICQSKYIVMSVKKFFEEEKRTGKSKLREQAGQDSNSNWTIKVNSSTHQHHIYARPIFSDTCKTIHSITDMNQPRHI